MAYVKTAWVNDSAPAVNATNLNKIEQGIYDAHVTADAAIAKPAAPSEGDYLRYEGGTWVRSVIPVCKVRRDITSPGTFSVPNGALTYVPMDIVDLQNPATMWVVGTPTRITVPRTGTYRVQGQCFWTGNAVGYRELYVVQNHTVPLAYSQVVPSVSSSNAPHQMCSGIALLAAGDYLELGVFQSSGGALDVSVGDGNLYEGFSVEWVG